MIKIQLETTDPLIIIQLLKEQKKQPKENIRLMIGDLTISLEFLNFIQYQERFCQQDINQTFHYPARIQCSLTLGKNF